MDEGLNDRARACQPGRSDVQNRDPGRRAPVSGPGFQIATRDGVSGVTESEASP
jgi:hypothetical protein